MDLFIKTGVIVILFLVIIQIGIVSLYYSSEEEIEMTITEKWIKGIDDGQKYLFSDGNEVFENTDSIYIWKWNSSDFWVGIKEGHTYRIKIIGWRIPILSWYRNVVSYEEI